MSGIKAFSCVCLVYWLLCCDILLLRLLELGGFLLTGICILLCLYMFEVLTLLGLMLVPSFHVNNLNVCICHSVFTSGLKDIVLLMLLLSLHI